MKRILIVLLAAAMLLVSLTACAEVGDKPFDKDGRFQIVKMTGTDCYGELILVDTETEILYVWLRDGDAGGLTPLLDRDGKIQYRNRH